MAEHEEKTVGLLRLFDGDDPKEIAADIGVTYATVIRWKTELRKAKDDNTVNQLLNLDSLALERLAKDSILDVPDELLPAMADSVEGVVVGVTGLQRLEPELQATASFINKRIKALASTATNVGEISELTDAICKLQNAFFAKGTNVQILNNINGGETYGQFLGDAPGS